MTVLYYILLIILGLLIGSFLNVCADRLPHRKSLIRPPSHCDSCSRRLAVLDLIPIFSYLYSRGRCRYCGEPIPRRVLWAEIVTGALFGLLFWYFGLTIDYAVVVFYSCVFLLLAVIDLEHRLLLNIILYPMMPAALLISGFWPGGQGVVYALIGGVAAFAIFLIIAIVSRGGMGFGDVKMAGLIGLATGFPYVFAALLAAIISGGVVAIILLLTGRKGRKQGIPFGPFLAFGAVVSLIWGEIMLDWYVRLIF